MLSPSLFPHSPRRHLSLPPLPKPTAFSFSHPKPSIDMRLPSSLLRLARQNPSSLLQPHLPLSLAAAPRPPSERVSAICDEISVLTLLEVADLSEMLRARLGVEVMPLMAVMTPGMSIAGPPAAGGEAVAEKKEEKKEKSAFDLRLESFDAAGKLKIIKEVRTFTALGLKEAKELVEKVPSVLKVGVVKEEAEKIVEKMKELGAVVVME